MSDERQPCSPREVSGAHEPGRWAPVAGIVAGAVLSTAGLAVAVLGAPAALSRAFTEIGATGIGDPALLAGRVGGVLNLVIAGVITALAGGALLVISFAALRRRERD